MRKRRVIVMRLIVMALCAWGVRTWAQGADVDARTQQIAALANALNAEREKTEALATAAVGLRAQLQNLQQQLAPACIAAVEKANPGKVVDPTSLQLTDKPATSAKPAPPAVAAGRGGAR